MDKNKDVMFPVEAEVDEWRAKVMEEYKGLMGNERSKKINEHCKQLAKEFGFKIV